MDDTGLTSEQRLDRLESRAAIADVIHGYARAIRRGDPESAAALFVADGSFEICDGAPGKEPVRRVLLEGREHYLVYLKRGGGSAAVCPLLHNIMITFDSADTARANAMLEAVSVASGHRTIGEYHDILRRVDGRWMFSGRQFVIWPASTDPD